MGKNLDINNMKFETQSIHAGVEPDPVTGCVNTPIYQSAAYVFKSAEHASDLFNLKDNGYVYSRLTNPTVDALEKRIAVLEGGIGATCTSSGHSAQLLAYFSLLSSGEDYISSNRLYGGSVSQIKNTFPRAFGWNGILVNPDEPENFKKALTEKTKFIFLESLANPSGAVIDIEAVARIAESAGIPLLVDNTMATPYLCKPLEYGANIIIYSTTKFLSGHGNAMGGAVVDGGNFDWKKHKDKYPNIAKNEPVYHGMNFSDTFGDAALYVHNHAVGLRDLGMCQQPMNAWLTLMGMETLSLRVERHCANALTVAKFLEKHPAVSWVNYSGLESSPYKKLQEKYMPKGAGSLFCFGLKGGHEAGIKFVESVKLISHLANLGDTRSLCIHPSSTTHSQLSEEMKKSAMAGPDVIRISIGIENVDDIIADIDQALKAYKA